MAFRLRGTFDLDAEITNSLDLTTVSAPLRVARQMLLAQGSGAGQADMIWSDQFTISASSTEEIDLAGTLTGPFGTTLTFARIKLVVVAAAPGNTNSVNVVRDSDAGAPLFLAAGDGIAVKPGGLFVWFDPSATGAAVTADTGDLINLVNSGSGSSVTCDIVVAGASS